jgi:hypothetical protein
MMLIEFDRAAHRYKVDGKPVINVTGVLEPLVDLSRIPRAVLENARARGVFVHECCDLDDRDALDDDSVPTDLMPYVTAWREWKRRTGATIIASELRVASKTHGYAGTLDFVADIKGKLVLGDRKVTAAIPAAVGPQTAAYAQAYLETFGHRIRDRIVVRIDQIADKTPSRRLTDPADWPTFMACLNIHRWKENNR